MHIRNFVFICQYAGKLFCRKLENFEKMSDLENEINSEAEDQELENENSESESVSEVEEENENAESSEGLGEEVSLDELDLDLESLKLPSANILGKAKPKPMLASNDTESKRSVGRPKKEDEGLFAWCEQFNYTPGVEFLKLARLFPKTWEGMNISGYIEDIYEPVDEHWLADRWGGGSYQFDAYQRDSTGRSRKTIVKFIEISGMPKNFMGSDGLPHPLPSEHKDRSRSSRRSQDVLRRRMGLNRFRRENEDYDENFDDDRTESMSRRSNTRNVDQPLQDASTLYKTIQETRKSENDALGVLREAQKDVHEQMQKTSEQQQQMYRQMLDQQKDEMRRLRDEQARSAESSTAPFKELLHFVSSQNSSSGAREQFDALRSAHESAVSSLTREHSKHLDNLRQNFESRQRQLQDELSHVRNQYSTEVERVRADYLEKEKSAKDDAFRNYQAQLEVLRQQTSEMRERQRDELANLSRDKNDVITLLRQEVSELRNQNLTKEANLKSDWLEKENKLYRQIEKLENSSKTNMLEERQRLKEEFEEKYEAKRQAITESYEAKMQALQVQCDLKVEMAQKEIKGKEKEFNSELKAKETYYESKLESLKMEYLTREDLANQRASLDKEASQRERDNQKLILETSAKSKEALDALMKKQLEQRNKELERQLAESLTQGSGVSGDPFDQLQRLTEIKDRLKEHGFISEVDKEGGGSDKSEEDKPKDMFGKILKYGPQIVGPILQRIDQATSVAQQAVQQQQQDLLLSKERAIAEQQRADQERQASAQREADLRARRQMLLERRIARDEETQQVQEMRQKQMQEALFAQQLKQEELARQQQEELARQQQEELARQQQEVPVQTPPQEVEQVVLDQNDQPITIEIDESQVLNLNESETDMANQSNEGYKKLADYLKEAVEAKKTASGIVGELKMALMMGMFSKDTLNEVLSNDFDTLIGILGGYHGELKSPKSRILLKDVLKGLK